MNVIVLPKIIENNSKKINNNQGVYIVKLHQILKQSKYKNEEILFFEQYSKNHAIAPENDSDDKEEPKKDDNKKDTKKVDHTDKKDDDKKDTDKPNLNNKHNITSIEKTKKPSIYQDIIKYGAYMGEGLYTISEYEYNHYIVTTDKDISDITNGRADDNSVFFNKLLYNIINKLKLNVDNPHDIEKFLSIEPLNFWKHGAIHCIIYDSFNDNILFFSADPTVRYTHVMGKNFDKAILSTSEEPSIDNSFELTENQIDVVKQSIKLGDQYISHFRSNPESKTTNLIRYKLLYSLGITLHYLPPYQISSY